ncbi:MAG: nuclear transport factor 2 family protein [Bacteroidota bacterium]
MKKEHQKQIIQLINQDYKNLWNKKEASPFNIEEASGVYLKDDGLTIIDPDFKMIDKDAPTKVTGYQKVMPQLAAPWEMISEGGINEIFNIDIKVMDDTAFVSFDARGKMRFTNNETLDLLRNVTQLLKNTESGWRIAYEHVS